MNVATLASLYFLVFLIERVAETLNLSASRRPLPPSIAAIQSTEDQQRASRYLKDRLQVAWVKEAFLLLVFLLMLHFGIFGSLQSLALRMSDSSFWQAATFAAILGVGQSLLSLPFSAYSTFVIEERYGFNRTTRGTFIGDQLKGLLIGAVLGGIVFYFAVRMFENQPDHAWWMIWLGYTAFQFFIVWIAPVTLLPLFLKLTPLKEGELRTALEGYARTQSFKLDGAWVCDASKRSAKSNAFFTGFGKFRRLVLFDTLIEKHPTSEIVAIVAHEAGHFKLGHIWKGSLLSAVMTLVTLYLLQKLIFWSDLYGAFGVTEGNVGMGLVIAGMLLGKLMFFISPIPAWFSRRNEYSADRFSFRTTGDALSLANGLKRLVKDNLATLQQHPLYVALHATHPPLPDRLKPLLAAGRSPTTPGELPT